MAAGGGQHSLLLRSDGQVIAFGSNKYGQCDVPAMEEHRRYVGVTAGYRHSVVLADDHRAFSFGLNGNTSVSIAGVKDGMRYIEAQAGGQHSTSLSEDGEVILSGNDTDGQCAYPAENVEGYISVLNRPENTRYTKVVAGKYHTVALRTDGFAVAIGDNSYGQCEVPELPEGVQYIDVATGSYHTVLLRDDGDVVAFGEDRDGQVQVPPKGLLDFYVDVAAGDYHTLLLRSDGKAIVFGRDTEGQCRVPDLPEDLRWGNPVVNVSASMSHGIKRSTGDLVIVCNSPDGAEVVNIRLDPELEAPCIGEIREIAAEHLRTPLWSIRLFDEDGRLIPFHEDKRSVLNIFGVEK